MIFLWYRETCFLLTLTGLPKIPTFLKIKELDLTPCKPYFTESSFFVLSRLSTLRRLDTPCDQIAFRTKGLRAFLKCCPFLKYLWIGETTIPPAVVERIMKVLLFSELWGTLYNTPYASKKTLSLNWNWKLLSKTLYFNRLKHIEHF